MGIEAEKSPCYLPGSSFLSIIHMYWQGKSLLPETNNNNATKHKQQTPANTTTYKTKYKKILLYIYASKVTCILIISSILTGLTVHKHDDINNWCYWSYW